MDPFVSRYRVTDRTTGAVIGTVHASTREEAGARIAAGEWESRETRGSTPSADRPVPTVDWTGPGARTAVKALAYAAIAAAIIGGFIVLKNWIVSVFSPRPCVTPTVLLRVEVITEVPERLEFMPAIETVIRTKGRDFYSGTCGTVWHAPTCTFLVSHVPVAADELLRIEVGPDGLLAPAELREDIPIPTTAEGLVSRVARTSKYVTTINVTRLRPSNATHQQLIQRSGNTQRSAVPERRDYCGAR